MTAPLSPASPGSLPGAAPDAGPEAHPPAPPLTLRQEDFCRHYAATGNAAGAARDAGYAAGSARQTGHELLDRPAVAARVRAIRAAWRAVEREEAQILLGRLEQAWDAAVEKGSAALMLRVVKLQADLSGLDRRHAHRRAGLWPLPGEEAEERPVDGAEGPIAGAVRRGRHRTERALAVHRANRKALERRRDFDEADWLAAAQRLHATVEERRPRAPGRTPERQAGRPAAAITEPDNSLHGSAHPAADAPPPDSMGDSAGDCAPGAPVMTDHDISLHRAGLLPAEGGGYEGIDPKRYAAWAANLARDVAAYERQDRDETPEARWTGDMPGAVDIQPPAGEPCPIERLAAEDEQEYLKELARTRPPLENRTAGMYLTEFGHLRPCRGEEWTATDHDEA